MKKSFKIIYIIIFLIACVTPLALMPFVKNDASLEKRELSEFPSYIKDGKLNQDFSTQFESWFNDRIPFRAVLLSGANAIKGGALHASTSNVIAAKDGWLFYDSEGKDYIDANPMSDDEVDAACITLSLIQENVTAKGGKFLFVPMPNKASVYGKHLPKCYKKAETTNLSRILEGMKEYEVNTVDMCDVFSKYSDKQLYHKRDSHWNYQGAMIGYNAIMDSLPRDTRAYQDVEFKVKKNWRADLDKLIYPFKGVLDDQYYYDIDYNSFMFMNPKMVRDNRKALDNFMSDKEEGDDLISTKSRKIKDGSTLFMARDSFGRALLPMMIGSYEEATFKRTDAPDINSITENTDFIYEIVERNLNRLAENVPFMYAPKRDNVDTANAESGQVKINADVQGYGISLYGKLPKEAKGSGRVYITLTNDSNSVTFEAFPICDKKLMGTKDTIKDNQRGFTAILENPDSYKGTYQVTVTTGNYKYDCGDIQI